MADKKDTKQGRKKKDENELNRKVIFSLSIGDEVIDRWLNAQANKSWSIKCLIQNEIDQNGIKDLKYRKQIAYVSEKEMNQVVEKSLEPNNITEEKKESMNNNVMDCYSDEYKP
jgi:hypothetical protein